MKILLIHNRYKFLGGEDSVFEAEKDLLESHGHDVRAIYFDNKNINSYVKTLKLSYQSVYNRDSEKIVTNEIENFKPEVIHIHNLFYLASPSILFAAAKNKVPVILTLHNYRLICSGALLMRDSKPCELCIDKVFPLDGIKYGCHRNSKIETAQLTFTTGLHKLLGTWTTKVTKYIALTDFAKEKFVNSSLKISSDKIVVKANSVDNTESVVPEERENYFLYIGRLSIEKGVQVLLDAFENRNIAIEIIGDGPFKSDVENIVAKNPMIKYHGFKEKEFIISKLKKCRALIIPSICYENLPTAILEAFSTGTPVIISDINNLNRIVSDGYNGKHFKTGNFSSLHSVVEDFRVNHTQFKHLYSNARKTFLEKYTHETNYNNLLNVYRDAIASNPIQ